MKKKLQTIRHREADSFGSSDSHCVVCRTLLLRLRNIFIGLQSTVLLLYYVFRRWSRNRVGKCLRVKSNNLKAMKRRKFCVSDRAKDGKILHVRVKSTRTFPDKIIDRRNKFTPFRLQQCFGSFRDIAAKVLWKFVYTVGFCALRQ